MARLARLALAQELHHVIQRGHDRELVFRDEADRSLYLQALRDQAHEHRVQIHAYVLLDREVELLATPGNDEALGRLMQGLGRRYVAAFNRRHGRSGTLWEGRYRASILESEHFLLKAMVYLAWRPVQEGLVLEPKDWAWSSAPHHLGLVRDPLVVDHRLYWTLGNTPFDRELQFRRSIEQGIPLSEAHALRKAALTSWPLGSETFLKSLADRTARPLERRPRGRPRKQGERDLSPK